MAIAPVFDRDGDVEKKGMMSLLTAVMNELVTLVMKALVEEEIVLNHVVLVPFDARRLVMKLFVDDAIVLKKVVEVAFTRVVVPFSVVLVSVAPLLDTPVRVGLLENTAAPEPVSSVRIAASFALVSMEVVARALLLKVLLVRQTPFTA